tara:strand:- start:1 stop:261 length:261 start_codon:yes stop_codon:yes gene_type:complete
MVEQETETVEELIDQFVGKKAKYTTQEGFNIEVTVQMIKRHFGRVDMEVMPVHGSGTKWVTQSKLLFAPSMNGQAPTTAETNNLDW